MDAAVFKEALNELAVAKGVSKETILVALKEALHKALEKEISNEYGMPRNDGDIRVEITEEPVEIKMCYVRKVVTFDDLEDDYLEITVEDANDNKDGKKYEVGDEYVVETSADQMKRLTALSVKSVLRQKLAEAEKVALYEHYKDKIGEMVTGMVEKCDDRGAVVNVGVSSLTLTRRELIGDEMLKSGQPVRLYVSKATAAESGKAPMVVLSRSDAGFVRRLFEEEVREIYDGTVIIKNLAREAGVRSKLAVYSNDPNVDPIGCCIGLNGNAIQKIVAQLGNGRDKEKIDIIHYSPNDALYIIDALKPAQVSKIGVYTDENGRKCAVAIVPNGTLSLAIGKKGANVRVASKLTETHIDIKEESMADEVEVELKTIETIQAEEKIRIRNENYDRYLSSIKKSAAQEAKTTNGVEKAQPKQILDEEIEEEVKVEVAPVVEEVKVEVAPVAEEAAPAPAVEEEKPVVKPTIVRTTTSIDALEASLETEKQKENFKATQKTSKRPHKITEEEVERVEEKPEELKQKMAIYSDAELAEMEAEDIYEDDYEDEEEIDYDQYDDYYDDDDK